MNLLATLIKLYSYVVLLRVILSWFPTSAHNSWAQIHRFVYAATEPVLAPIRKLVPPFRVGAVYLDISVMIFFVLLTILQRIL